MAGNARLAQLLSNNEAPNFREVEDVKTEMTLLSGKISQLRAQLEGLEEEFNRYNAIISPMRKIPLELLGEIFQMALPISMESCDYRSGLLKLCLVCKNWRHAAHLMRQLWSELHLQDRDLHYRKIVNWFSRAGEVPKTLSIRARCSYAGHSSSVPCSLSGHDASRLLASGPSLHHLSLNCSNIKCFMKMIDALETLAQGSHAGSRPFDRIRSLTLDLTGRWRRQLANSTGSGFHRIPTSVTSFQLLLPPHSDAFGPVRGERPLHLPPQFLGNLTSFSICSDWEGGVQLLTALHHCVNVETLTIDFNDSLTWWYDSSEPSIELFRTEGLPLPKVRTLSLERASPASISILNVLKAPSLESLSITFTYCDDMEDYDLGVKLCEFIKIRSQCEATFRSLRLENLLGFRAEGLQSLLQDLPTITHLTLDRISLIPSYLPTLAHLAVPSEEKFLPNLESLEIRGLDPESVKRGAGLFSFLNARRRHDPMDYWEGGVIFKGPPDSLKELRLDFAKTDRLRRHGLDHDASVCAFKEHCGVSFYIGPLLYDDDPCAEFSPVL
ncbi:hypothetical protein MD484_g6589, partial [Candolleomyces efflorescens]